MSSSLISSKKTSTNQTGSPVTGFEKWERPMVTGWNPLQSSLIFQQIVLDHYIEPKPIPGMPGARVGPVPIIRWIAISD